LPNVIRTFFRHCPNCGRRFEIRLVSEKEVDGSEVLSKNTLPATPPGIVGSGAGGTMGRSGGYMMLTNSTNPIVIESRELQDTYKCGHCGHMWTEIREDDKRVNVSHEAVEELTEQDMDGPSSRSEIDSESGMAA
jgi:predicted RNA-binding Zn-ribbon protein involved in translation (DUF1610 family)